MINSELHRKPVPLDREKHRRAGMRLPVADWSRVAGINALFLTAAECVHAARDFPILFIKAGEAGPGKAEFAPIAVFGLTAGENLYVDGSRWRASHTPAVMALYPLCVARLEGDRYAVCVDESYEGLTTDGSGERFFGDDGEPSEFMRRAQADLERLEKLIDQTRGVCRHLVRLDLLVERRYDATLPDGAKLSVDGFFTVDEERVRKLPDETVLELHHQGVLAVIQSHWVSMGHMQRLLEWRLARQGQVRQA